VIPPGVAHVDYEAELAAVIGARVKGRFGRECTRGFRRLHVPQ
jgi:2-keto-4-pentenoate hydratase/2-oxohepta-3-ene-1,7-dioic acid hydratase in catechol pathway